MKSRKLKPTAYYVLQAILALVFAGAIVGDLYSVNESVDASIEAQKSAADEKTKLLGLRIDDWLRTRKTEISTLGNTPVIRSMDWEQSGPFVKGKHNAMPWFYIFAHINPDGSYYNSKVDFAKGKNLKDRAHVKAALQGRVYASDPVVSRTLGTDIVAVTSPIYQNDSEGAPIIGVFGGMIDTQTINDELAAFRNGPDSYALALTSGGIAISHPDAARRGNINTKAYSLREDNDPGLSELAKKMAANTSGNLDVSVDGQQVYASFLTLTETDWSIATLTDRRTVEADVTNIYAVGAATGVLLFVVYLMSILLIRSQYNRLDQERQISEEKNQAKSVFIANMSHELRTPLNGVLGYAQIMLADPNLQEKARERLSLIVQSGQNLLALINRILDISKLEAGKMELEPHQIHLESYLNDVVRVLEVESKRFSSSLVVTLGTGLSRLIYIDANKCSQIINNIATNAMKYGQGNPVHISAEVANEDADRQLRVVIRDEGKGMTDDEVALAFEPFHQTDARREGIGLGLAIVKDIVSLMGGTIHMDSAPGEGTKVTVMLPLSGDEEVGDQEQTSNLYETAYRYEGTVLVVDDNPINRDVLESMLTAMGLKVHLAEDGVEALGLLDSLELDLLITDLVMPNMDGFELIANVRKAHDSADLPIIVVSASAMPGDQVRAMSIGTNVFLTKPIDQQLLLRHIATIFGAAAQNEERSRRDIDSGLESSVDIGVASDYDINAEDAALIDDIVDAAETGQINQITRRLQQASDTEFGKAIERLLKEPLDRFDFDGVVGAMNELKKRYNR